MCSGLCVNNLTIIIGGRFIQLLSNTVFIRITKAPGAQLCVHATLLYTSKSDVSTTNLSSDWNSSMPLHKNVKFTDIGFHFVCSSEIKDVMS